MTTDLAAAIHADPHDTTAYSVLADWLQTQGDPRGELIALQLANKDDEARAMIAARSDHFLGELAAHQKTYDGEDADTFTWKYGFIHALRLSHNHYANSAFKGSLGDVLEQVLTHPSGRFLSEITFVFNNDPNENTLQNLIDILAAKAPPTIRKLHFGDFKYAGAAREEDGGEDTEISWYAIGDLGGLWQAVPHLRTLITQGGSGQSTIAGSGLGLGTIDLPHLTHAEFRTGGLEQASAQAIAAAAIPNIAHLDIWYGQDNYGGDATVDDVAPLLARTDLPALRHLGLMNAAFTDELVPLLAKSPLAAQLTELDLSLGCLSDAGAAALAEHKAKFPKLGKLDVSHSYLTAAGVEALRGFAPTVVADNLRTADDDDDRYPAVGE